VSRLLRVVANIYTGNPSAAINELSQLEDKRDFGIVWHLAMLSAHNKCKYIDKEAIAALEAKMTILKSKQMFSERTNILAGWFCLLTKNYAGADTYFTDAFAQNPRSVSALVGKSWLQISMGSLSQGNPFSICLEKSPEDLEALVGNCYYLRKTKKLGESLTIIDKLIGYYPNFLPAYIEKIHIQLENQSWDAAIESAQRLGGLFPDSIDSMVMISLFELCWEGSTNSAALYLATTKNVLFLNVVY
jgi:tetratricopeptide (TPR) repeat protein